MLRSPVTMLALLAACGGDGPFAADAGVDASIRAQGSEPRAELAINEVSPRGPGPDWLEILNRSSEPIDLCDYFVTDSLDRLDHYLPLGGTAPPDPCEVRLLDPGGYLVVIADDDRRAGIDHAPFKLGEADEAHVVTATGIPVDSFLYLYPVEGAGQSLARAPDGEGLFLPSDPTPGAANPEGVP